MQMTYFFLKNNIYLWLRWIFLAADGLSLVTANGGSSSCGVPGSGFSCSCGLQALECGLSGFWHRGLAVLKHMESSQGLNLHALHAW